MASIYRRGKVYYIKFYEGRRRVRRSLRVTKRSEAVRIKENIERELAAGRYQLDLIDTAVDVFWPRYLKWAIAHKSSKTVENEALFWKQFIIFAKPKKLGDVTPRHIERFKAKRKADGLQNRSINDALRFLQVIFSYARKLGYYTGPNPFKGITRYKEQKNSPRYLKKNEIRRVLKVARQHGRDIHLVFALGIYAGLRKNEIVNARWEWFDFEQKLITLSSHEGFHLKDAQGRTVPLHNSLAAILNPYRASHGFVLLPNKDRPGKHRYRYEFRRPFKKVVKEANVEWITPHVLRHTFASQLAIAGVSLYKISKWLGHSDTKTTQVYAHLQTHDEDINRF